MKIVQVAVFCFAACSGGTKNKPSSADVNRYPVIATDAQQRACGVTSSTNITARGIGALAIGTSAEFVKQNCRILLDTVSLGPEAKPTRTLTVDMVRDTIEAVIVRDRVWRLEVGGHGFTTDDSLRVGTPIGELLGRGDVRGREGEGLLYVVIPGRCGMSFRLGYVPKDTEHRAEWTARDLSALPPATGVDQILVFGCDDK